MIQNGRSRLLTQVIKIQMNFVATTTHDKSIKNPSFLSTLTILLFPLCFISSTTLADDPPFEIIPRVGLVGVSHGEALYLAYSEDGFSFKVIDQSLFENDTYKSSLIPISGDSNKINFKLYRSVKSSGKIEPLVNSSDNLETFSLGLIFDLKIDLNKNFCLSLLKKF